MRYPSVIVLLACAGLTCAAMESPRALAAEQFPYTAYTISNDVYIRSGPGKNYYPTDKLPRGEAVEVYRQDPGGWYAIRPPQGSFSWVPADVLKPLGDRLAVVEKDQALCFVGTRFSNARDIHQVRLDKGEQVEIFDIKQIGEGADAQSWCQIAPPSGEFRWVFGKFVDREPPSGVSRPTADHAAPPDVWTAKGSAVSDSAARLDTNWRPTATKAAAAPKADSVAVDPFQTELDSIDVEVSRIAADDPSTWEFTALRRRTEAALPRAETALERGRVRLILNRMARFEDIKRRHDLLTPAGTGIAIASRRTSVLPVDDSTRFDGVGKLTPVVSQRPNAPRYALVDEANQVVSFVTPSPGVNLQPYVGKAVGVSGQRGYMPELRKPHVTALRINLLDDGPALR